MRHLSLGLLLAALVATPSATRAGIRWEQTPDAKIKIKTTADGREIGRWIFSKSGEPTVEVVWEDTATERVKIKRVGGKEVGRWSFPLPLSARPAPSPVPMTGPDPIVGTRAAPSAGVAEDLRKAREARTNGDRRLAHELLTRLLPKVDRAGADPLELAEVLTSLGVLLADMGRFRQAEPHLLRALSVYGQAGQADSPQAADLHTQLGRVYGAERSYDQAETELLAALQIREQYHGAEHPAVANLLYLMALLAHEQGELVRAEPLYMQALAVFRKAEAEDHPAHIKALRFYARFLREMNRTYEAASYERKAAELLRQ